MALMSMFSQGARALEALNNVASKYATLIVTQKMNTVDCSEIGKGQLLLIDFTNKTFTLYSNPKGTMPVTGTVEVSSLGTYYYDTETVTLS